MTTVKLNNEVVSGSVVFSVSESTKHTSKYFSQPLVKDQLKGLYKERYQLNSWRTFDKSYVMQKAFGK